MIPKIIHYCWFGNAPLPELAIKCISSWKRFCPDYEIKEWNEDNFDIACCPYVAEAYLKKKWAFVSDYARFWILYNYGGLYFDTDVELIKSIDDIVERGAFMGVEKCFDPQAFYTNKQDFKSKIDELTHQKLNVNPGLGLAAAPGLGLAAAPGLGLYKEILDYYQNEHFISKSGNLNLTTVVHRVSSILLRHQIIAINNDMLAVSSFNGEREIYIYQKDFFCPFDYETYAPTKAHNNIEMLKDITSNTRSIHHFAASWHTRSMKVARSINRFFARHGKSHSIANKLIAAPFILINKWREVGSIGTLKFVANKLTPPPRVSNLACVTYRKQFYDYRIVLSNSGIIYRDGVAA